jgi:hypothetical protein
MFNLKTTANNAEELLKEETKDTNKAVLQVVEAVDAFRKAREEHLANKDKNS